MKDFIKEKDGKEVSIEDYLSGKKQKEVIVRGPDGLFRIPGDAWKNTPLTLTQFNQLVQSNFINFGKYEVDDKPYRRGLFYKHLDDCLKEVVEDKHKVWRDVHR